MVTLKGVATRDEAERLNGIELYVPRDRLPETDDDETNIVSERQMLARRAAELIRNEFEPRTWQAFWLTAVEQHSAGDAAARLGTTAGAVRQAKYVVLRRLREELAGEVD